jgi:carbonic anhydrase
MTSAVSQAKRNLASGLVKVPPSMPGTALTPDAALALLKEGNAAFISDTPIVVPSDHRRRMEIATAQTPFAILVGCSDSRVSPEILFRRGLGELFIVRVAGNTVDRAGLGSIEYAVAQLGVPLIVVLGHERCGAVQAAVDVVERDVSLPGSIGELVGPIIPAVLKARHEAGDLLTNAVRENIRRVALRIVQSSPIVGQAVAAGRVKVARAYYDLAEGTVDFSV